MLFFLFFLEGTTIEYLVNERIREKEVRVIGAEGGQLGVMGIKEALQMAEEADMDLVLVSPNAKPPVCRIVDWHVRWHTSILQQWRWQECLELFSAFGTI